MSNTRVDGGDYSNRLHTDVISGGSGPVISNAWIEHMANNEPSSYVVPSTGAKKPRLLRTPTGLYNLSMFWSYKLQDVSQTAGDGPGYSLYGNLIPDYRQEHAPLVIKLDEFFTPECAQTALDWIRRFLVEDDEYVQMLPDSPGSKSRSSYTVIQVYSHDMTLGFRHLHYDDVPLVETADEDGRELRNIQVKSSDS